MTKQENSYYGKEDQGKICFIGCFDVSPSEVKQFFELNQKVFIFYHFAISMDLLTSLSAQSR